MRRLEAISQESRAVPRRDSSSSPDVLGANILTAAQAFAERVGDPGTRAKLQELRQEVGALLGEQAVAEVTGVYNSLRLYRFLLGNEMDVYDAKSKIGLNSIARAELEMDAKRVRIVREDLGFATLPRAAEFRAYVPGNPFAGRAKDGRVVEYHCLGAAIDLEGLQRAFSVQEATELLLYNIELSRMLLDALGAAECRNISSVSFYDCSGGRLHSLFKLMWCEFWLGEGVGGGGSGCRDRRV